MLGDLLCKFAGTEGHAQHVVACSNAYLLFRLWHQLESAFNGIIGVDHGEIGILFQVAGIYLLLQCLIEDINSIISGSSSGNWPIPDEPWVSDTSDIDSVALVVVLAPEFTGFFGDAVDGCGVHDSLLGSVLGGVGTEGCDWTWPEHAVYLVLTGWLETVVEGFHVDLLGYERVDLTCSWEQSTKTIELIDLIFGYNVIDIFSIDRIEGDMMFDFEMLWWVFKITTNDVIHWDLFTQT